MALDHPLKVRNAKGDLQRVDSDERDYLAYLVSQQLIQGDSAEAGNLGLSFTNERSIGSFVDTIRDQAPGTHPASAITTTTVTTNLKVCTNSLDDADSDFRRPVATDANGDLHEMNDTNFNSLVDSLNARIAQYEMPGSFRLATSSPGVDWDVWHPAIFEDTNFSNPTVTYNLYRRERWGTAPDSLVDSDNNYTNIVSLKRSSGKTGTWEGVQRMTTRQAQVSLGEMSRVRRAVQGAIGSYVLAQSAPSEGTWEVRGTATNTLLNTSLQEYTRNRIDTRPQNFTGDYVTNFTRDAQETYTGDYATNYATLYETNFTRDSLESFESLFTTDYQNIFTTNYISTEEETFTGTYEGNYTTAYQTDYETNYIRSEDTNFASLFTTSYVNVSTRINSLNYISSEEETYTGDYTTFFQTNYVGDYTGTFIGDFTNTYQGEYTTNYANYSNGYIGTVLEYYTTAYQSNYITTYTGDYIGAATYTGTYTGDFVTTYVGAVNYTGPFDDAISYALDVGYTAQTGDYATGYGKLFYYANEAQQQNYAISPLYIAHYTATSNRSYINVNGIEYVTNSIRNVNSTRTSTRYIPYLTLYYIGDFTATIGYISNYAGPSIPYTASYDGASYQSDFVGTVNYTGATLYASLTYFTNNYTVDTTYTGTLYYTTSYIGVRNYNGPAYFETNYISTEEESFIGVADYISTTDVAYQSNYETTYTGNYIQDFVADFATTYTSLTDVAYISVSTRIAEETYTGDYVNQFTRGYTGTYTGDFITDYEGNYEGNFATSYENFFTGTFIGDFVAHYATDYQINYVSQSEIDYTGTYTGDFTTDYTNFFVTDYSGTFSGLYTGDFISHYQQDYTQNYSTDYTGTYTGDFEGAFTTNYEGNFARLFIGNYIGLTVGITSSSITYNLYVRTA